MPFKAEGTAPVTSKICPQNFDAPGQRDKSKTAVCLSGLAVSRLHQRRQILDGAVHIIEFWVVLFGNLHPITFVFVIEDRRKNEYHFEGSE